MKALVLESGQILGPFLAVEALADRYRCDETEFPFSVIGAVQLVDAADVVFPTPPEPPAPVPASLSPFQAYVTLDAFQLLDDVEAMMLAESTPKIVRFAYAKVTEWRRDSPVLLWVKEALGLTDDDLDTMFRYGAKVVA